MKKRIIYYFFTCSFILIFSGCAQKVGLDSQNTDENIGEISPADTSTTSIIKSAEDVGSSCSASCVTNINLFCWGSNQFGQTGINNDSGNGYKSVLEPTQLQQISGVIEVAQGGFHTCTLNQYGTVNCFGLNDRYQLGVSNINHTANPQAVESLPDNVVSIAAGFRHNCALTREGKVYCWGDNSDGQLGQGKFSNPTPIAQSVNLNSTLPAIRIAAGGNTSCAVLKSGQVKCWGNNTNFQIGTDAGEKIDGGPAYVGNPTFINNLNGKVVDIAVGNAHVCALLASRTIMCWGYNEQYQLGNSTKYDNLSTPTPTKVQNLSGTPVSVTAGANSTCSLMSDSSARCWGGNIFGQLGNPNNTKSREATPQVVHDSNGNALTKLYQVKAADTSACVLSNNHIMQCFGNNSSGQLGINTAGGYATTPRQVNNITGKVLHLFNNADDSTVCAIIRP